MIFLNLLPKKKCSECGEIFFANLINYFAEKRGKYGLRSKCKKCFQAKSKAIKAIPKNREKSRIAGKKHYAENKKACAEKWKIYYNANSEHLKEKAKIWGKANRDKGRIYDRKRREDVGFRISSSISRSIRQSLLKHSGKNGAPWESLVGFTIKQLKRHLEKQFTNGMDWNNYGEWHIDHKIPQSVFNFTKPDHEDFKKCWALSNLQPLWALENVSKGAKLTKHFQPSLLI